MTEPIRIAIADDHQLVTQSLSDFLSSNLDCEIVFMASNGQELVDEMLKHKVDIVLLDINMPVMDGLQALRILRSRNGKEKIIVLSMHNDEAMLLKLLKLKVNGFLSKSGSGEELLTAISAVQKKGHYFNERLVEVMYHSTTDETMEEEGKEQKSLEELDDVDIDILRMICDELTSREMAEHLALSHRTIEGRRKRLLKALGAKNQAGLVIYAIKKGIVEL